MLICANSLLNSCNSRIPIEAHVLRSHQLVDYFLMSLPIKAVQQNLGFGAAMSRICKTFSQIASPRTFVWTHVNDLSQQFNRFLYFEIIHVSDQLRSDQITIIYRVSSLMYHSSSSIYHASLIIPVVHHLSSIIYHSSFLT